MSNFLLNKADFKQIIESDQYVIVKKGIFVGKGYACDGRFKLNVEMNKTSTSVYMLSSTNFWHARLCHINDRYVGIMSILGLIPIVKRISKSVRLVVKSKSLKGLIFKLKEKLIC